MLEASVLACGKLIFGARIAKLYSSSDVLHQIGKEDTSIRMRLATFVFFVALIASNLGTASAATEVEYERLGVTGISLFGTLGSRVTEHNGLLYMGLWSDERQGIFTFDGDHFLKQSDTIPVHASFYWGTIFDDEFHFIDQDSSAPEAPSHVVKVNETRTGVTPVATIPTGVLVTSELHPTDTNLYFIGTIQDEQELFRFDGSQVFQVPGLSDINPGGNAIIPGGAALEPGSRFAAVGNKLFFTAVNPDGGALYWTDGTEVVQVPDTQGAFGVLRPTSVGDVLTFNHVTQNSGAGFYSTDGSSIELLDAETAGHPQAVFEEELYFPLRGLSKTNGQLVTTISDEFPNRFFEFQGDLYFTSGIPNEPEIIELFKTDGQHVTATGRIDTNGSLFDLRFFEFQGELHVVATDDDGSAFYSTDGFAAFSEIHLPGATGNRIRSVASQGSFFLFTDNDNQLFMFDGNSTTPVNLELNDRLGNPFEFSDNLFFTELVPNDFFSDIVLWRARVVPESSTICVALLGTLWLAGKRHRQLTAVGF